jgi:hypothetical protein
VMGNYHAQFLGGLGAAMPPGYPVHGTFCMVDNHLKFYKHCPKCLLKVVLNLTPDGI